METISWLVDFNQKKPISSEIQETQSSYTSSTQNERYRTYRNFETNTWFSSSQAHAHGQNILTRSLKPHGLDSI